MIISNNKVKNLKIAKANASSKYQIKQRILKSVRRNQWLINLMSLLPMLKALEIQNSASSEDLVATIANEFRNQHKIAAKKASNVRSFILVPRSSSSSQAS
jgi:hypothetical protein